MRVHVDRGAETGLGHVPRAQRRRREQHLQALGSDREDRARGGGRGVRGTHGAHPGALAPNEQEHHWLAGCPAFARQLVREVALLGDPAAEEGGERGRQRLRRRARRGE